MSGYRDSIVHGVPLSRVTNEDDQREQDVALNNFSSLEPRIHYSDKFLASVCFALCVCEFGTAF